MQINIKTSKQENSENGIKGLATVTFGDSFKVQSIAIKDGKNGLFVAMPSYKTKAVGEDGNPVYKDICNPITKDFRDQLYAAILDSYLIGRDMSIGEDDGRTAPKFGVKVTPLKDAGSTLAIARLYLEDAFIVNNITVKETKDGHQFAAMPSYKTDKTGEDGKPVYKDICYPVTKDFREALQTAVVSAYLESQIDIKNYPKQGVPTEELPFDVGSQDPVKNPEKGAMLDQMEAKRPYHHKPHRPKPAEKPKSLKDRLADGEAKKAAQVVEPNIDAKSKDVVLV